MRVATVIGVRHGEVHNPGAVIYAGLPGFGLSEAGRAQAAAVATALAAGPVVAVYASPLDRAQETASAIAEATGAAVVADERLEEWRHWHQWAGLTWDELRERGREAWDAYTTDPGSVTSGESLDELADRMGSWLEDVRVEHPSGVVVGVSHLEPLRAILLRLLGRPASELFTVDIPVGGAVRLWPDPDARPLAPDAIGTLG